MANNSRYAPVAPPQILLALKEVQQKYGVEAFGDYHLLLAHDIIEQPEAYQKVFTPDLWQDNSNFKVIIDNSAVELGSPCTAEEMSAAVELLGIPWEHLIVVLPDYIGNAPMTVRSIIRAVDEWADVGLKNFMLLPQGDNGDEFKWCIERLASIEHPEAKYWGIPRHAVSVVGSRLPVANYAHIRRPDWPMHMFGFSDNLLDDMRNTNHHSVMGIDSAVPVRLGLLKVGLRLGSYESPPRGDYWEQQGVNKQAIKNILQVREWVRRVI